MGTPSSSVTMPRARAWGSSASWLMSYTGAAAAWAASKVSSTSAIGRAAHHSAIRASTSSRWPTRPAKPARRGSSSRPTISITRWATDSALVEMATQAPSAQR